ncbi:WecB/TagA/CpsF family glycosyltransferase [Bacteroidales bacterium OttesenSCG-928-M11]|nr:WecB/TagA/CpsF family glycosyltransferase [Bacteroidales bacterium OttesenSCG-928-M11]
MESYFGIRYCFEKDKVHSTIENMVNSQTSGYVCVADGVTLAMSYKNSGLKTVLDNASLITCDSGWVPLYLKSLYSINKEQYSGSDLMMDLIEQKKYNILFIGSSDTTLAALKEELTKKDARIGQMGFISLPFREVDKFDYDQIAQTIEVNSPDIIFVSLGMPKQEFFMSRLKPYITKGVMIGVGAAFKFHSGLPNEKRAPRWMIKSKMEWVYRIFSEPKKQIKRCSLILVTMPRIYWKEYRKKQ